MEEQNTDQQKAELPLDKFLKRPQVAKVWEWITQATTVVEDIHSRLHKRRALYVIVISLLSLVILAVGLCAVWLLGLSGSVYTLIATLVAAPPLFVVWMFRDEDKQQDIENARTDNLQKDFHQIQKWATKSEEGVSDSLQIAAIHQLKPYLLGDNGPPFCRPTYEIYKVLLDEQMRPQRDENGFLSKNHLAEFKKRTPQSHIKAIHSVLREILQEDGALYRVFPEATMPLGELNLCLANLAHARLQDASLKNANLVGADLLDASLQKAQLFGAGLENAKLDKAHLVGAKLNQAHVEDASLQWAKLQNAEMVNTYIMGSDLIGAEIDQSTKINQAIYSYNARRLVKFRTWPYIGSWRWKGSVVQDVARLTATSCRTVAGSVAIAG